MQVNSHRGLGLRQSSYQGLLHTITTAIDLARLALLTLRSLLGSRLPCPALITTGSFRARRACVRSRQLAVGAPRRRRICRVLGPWVLLVLVAQLGASVGIRAGPEGRQVGGDCDGTTRRREQVQQHLLFVREVDLISKQASGGRAGESACSSTGNGLPGGPTCGVSAAPNQSCSLLAATGERPSPPAPVGTIAPLASSLASGSMPSRTYLSLTVAPEGTWMLSGAC